MATGRPSLFHSLVLVVAVVAAGQQAEAVTVEDYATEPGMSELGPSLGETGGATQPAGAAVQGKAAGLKKGAKKKPMVSELQQGMNALNAYQKIQDTLNARAVQLRDMHDHPAKPGSPRSSSA